MMLLFGCSPNKSPNDSNIDRSFLTGKPCEVPCWYGLKIGESTKEDAQRVISPLPFVDTSTIRESLFADGGGSLDFNCIDSMEKICGWLFFTAEGEIYVIGYIPMYDLAIQDMINRLGPPNNFFAVGPDHNNCAAYFFWPEWKIRALLDIKPKYCKEVNNGKINLKWQINQLIYSEIDNGLIKQGIIWSNKVP